MKYFTYLFSILLLACESNYPGFHEVDDNLYRQVYVIGDDNKPVKPNSVAKVNFSLKNKLDQKPIFSDTGVYFLMQVPYENDVLKAISFMDCGDSACYILRREDPEQKNAVSEVLLYVSVKDVLSREEYENHMADFELRSEQREMNEIDSFFTKEGKQGWKLTNGMHYKIEHEGSGLKPQKGDWITIHYTGYFLNGKKFDSTRDTEAFSFTYGDPQQVIKGFEMALSLMSENSKLKIVIPSQLGFGAQGSSNRTVRPYTPLIYDIELTHITKPL